VTERTRRPAEPDKNDHLLLIDDLKDRLQRFRDLGSDDVEADHLLNELGGSGKVELDIVTELSVEEPIAHPEGFATAHAVAMHALEVLARNGARPPSQLRAGPLTGPAQSVVQPIIRYIVRGHQTHVANSIRDLYTRRLGWMPHGHPCRLPMVRARLDAERAAVTYKQSGGGLPTALVGGAVVSSVAQVARTAVGAIAGSKAGVVAAAVGTFLLLAAAAWAVLRGAAVARRRIRLTLTRPLDALWQTIGSCGHPPHDSAQQFALIAIVLTAVGWVLVPLATLAFTLLI
jgi:hypothetical protein